MEIDSLPHISILKAHLPREREMEVRDRAAN